MSNPSSTSNSEHEQNLALLGKPRRAGTIGGAVLFLLLNLWVAWLYHPRQAQTGKPYGPHNSWGMWDVVNADKADIKVIFLGNSVQQHYLDFARLQQKLQAQTAHTVRVFNLGSEGSYPYQYAAMYSQLKITPGTIIVVPTYCQNFMGPWNIFGTDLGALIVRPALLRLLPSDYVRENVSPAHLTLALLKNVVPVYRLKDTLQHELRGIDPAKVNNTALRTLLQDWKTSTAQQAQVLENTLTNRKSEQIDWVYDIYAAMLGDMQRRGVNHFVYIVPTLPDMGWRFDEVVARARAILKKLNEPYTDLTFLQPDGEFFDAIHPRNSRQLEALVDGTQELIPAAVVQVSPDRAAALLAGLSPAPALKITPAPAVYELNMEHPEAYLINYVHWQAYKFPPAASAALPARGFWFAREGRFYMALPDNFLPVVPGHVRIEAHTLDGGPFMQLFHRVAAGLDAPRN